jgi:hypothetical protein
MSLGGHLGWARSGPKGALFRPPQFSCGQGGSRPLYLDGPNLIDIYVIIRGGGVSRIEPLRP